VLTPALFLVGCDGSGLLGTIEAVEELRAESESGDPQGVEFGIFFETPNQMCPFDASPVSIPGVIPGVPGVIPGVRNCAMRYS
jgi:hypothetical protein